MKFKPGKQHYLGKRIHDRLCRFSGPISEEQFVAEVASVGLPASWVAWHLEEDEDVTNSERCRLLRGMPLIARNGSCLVAIPVDPDASVVWSPLPLADPISTLYDELSRIPHDLAGQVDAAMAEQRANTTY